MSEETNLRLESLQQGKTFCTWVFTIIGVTATTLGFFGDRGVSPENEADTKLLLIAGGFSFLCAATVLVSVPFATRVLTGGGNGHGNGGLDYRILGRLPLRLVLAAVYISVVVAGVSAFRIEWRGRFDRVAASLCTSPSDYVLKLYSPDSKAIEYELKPLPDTQEITIVFFGERDVLRTDTIVPLPDVRGTLSVPERAMIEPPQKWFRFVVKDSNACEQWGLVNEVPLQGAGNRIGIDYLSGGHAFFLNPGAVYIQIASENQESKAKEIQQALQQQGISAPGFDNVGKKGKAKIPQNTEVRYFHAEDKEAADSIVQFLKDKGMSSAAAVPVLPIKASVGNVEIWFSSTD